jgi:hypothetical protein
MDLLSLKATHLLPNESKIEKIFYIQGPQFLMICSVEDRESLSRLFQSGVANKVIPTTFQTQNQIG